MKANSRTPKRAARLAAMLPLWRSGVLQLYSFSQIGRMIGMNRSTALRDMRDLEMVSRLEPFYARIFGGRATRPKKVNRN